MIHYQLFHLKSQTHMCDTVIVLLPEWIISNDTETDTISQHDHVWLLGLTCQVAQMIFCAVLCLPVVPPPGDIKFLSVKPNSVALSWGCPKGLEGPKSFRVKWSSCMKVEGSLVISDFHKIEINNLQLGQQYFFSVATEDKDGNLSEWVTASVFTGNISYSSHCNVLILTFYQKFYFKWLLSCSGTSPSTLNERTFRSHGCILKMDPRGQHGGNPTSVPYNSQKSRKRVASNVHQRLLQDVLWFRARHRVCYLCFNSAERSVQWAGLYNYTHRWEILTPAFLKFITCQPYSTILVTFLQFMQPHRSWRSDVVMCNQYVTYTDQA